MVNKNTIFVSVLVITYNHEKYVAQCIESILNQKTDFPFEILIHDDASVDRTQEIIKRYQLRYPYIIKSVLETENQFSKGKVHPDEYLFALVKGKYVCIVEGDDFWCDQYKLQKQFDVLEWHSSCSICVHKTQCIDTEGNQLNAIKGDGIFREGVIPCNEVLRIFFVNNEWAFQTSSYFMRSDIFLNRPEFWDKFYVGDLPMILWFAHNGNFFFLDEIMSCYRIFSEGSATNLNRKREYAIRKAKTNAEGLIAFNEYTNGAHWNQLRHITSFYVYQYYCASSFIISEKYLNIAKKELSIREKIIAKIKFTRIGYRIRNLREDISKMKLRKGNYDGKGVSY